MIIYCTQTHRNVLSFCINGNWEKFNQEQCDNFSLCFKKKRRFRLMLFWYLPDNFLKLDYYCGFFLLFFHSSRKFSAEIVVFSYGTQPSKFWDFVSKTFTLTWTLNTRSHVSDSSSLLTQIDKCSFFLCLIRPRHLSRQLAHQVTENQRH